MARQLFGHVDLRTYCESQTRGCAASRCSKGMHRWGHFSLYGVRLADNHIHIYSFPPISPSFASVSVFSFRQVAKMSTPTPAQIEYMQAHISDNRKLDLIASVAVPLSIATIAVFLRFVARHRARAPLLADDWLILASLVCGLPMIIWRAAHDLPGANISSGMQVITFGYDTASANAIHNGVGRHIILVKDPEAVGKVKPIEFYHICTTLQIDV